ncbi:GATOR complex protein NPRL2 isoform X3 [Culicoides brevitarsis]
MGSFINPSEGPGPLKAIFLSEFHDVHGSKISCQAPINYISKEHFHAINVYIIPKPQLQRCILTVNVLDHKIVGFPVKLESDKYVRNAFYFNLCFVCEANRRTVQYEALVQKLTEYLIQMEHESNFLSDDRHKDQLQAFLERVLRDLNETGMTLFTENKTTIFLKIINVPADPPAVFDHLVPHITSPVFLEVPKENWDLTTQQILPFINGQSHVAHIAEQADVNGTLTRSCIQNLVYYGVLGLLPLLKYSNIYMCTRDLQKLTKNPQLARDCRQYVVCTREKKPPSLLQCLQIYAAMTHGVTLKALCLRFNPREHNIDERRLVTFGLQHKLIRIINKYPVFTGKVPVGRQTLYTGLLSIDEICCLTKISPAAVEEDIETDSNITVIWK